MYVNPFWFGVIMTVLAELLFIVIWAFTHRNTK